jgi:hypothetical protein
LRKLRLKQSIRSPISGLRFIYLKATDYFLRLSMFPRFKFVSAIALLLALAGCQSMGKLLLSGLVESSKYQPGIVSSEADVDRYMAVVTPVSGTVVSDELGMFYHTVDGSRVFVGLLRRDDDVALKNAFANTKGLLEPEYMYDQNGQLSVDWGETMERHAFLVNEMKLNLLPISETQKYHTLLAPFAAKRSLRGTGAVVSDAFSSNIGLYTNQYAQEVLDKISSNFGYLITTRLTDVYFLGLVNSAAEPLATARANLILAKGISFRFYTRNFYSATTKGGQFRFASGCHFSDSVIMKQQANFTISQAMAESKNRSAANDRGKLMEAIADYRQLRLIADRNCKTALQAMQVTGAVQSQRLK